MRPSCAALRSGVAWICLRQLCCEQRGRAGDRRGRERLLLPGLLMSAFGLAAVSLTSSSVSVLVGAAVFGAGFGVLQNATMTVMYARVRPEMFSTVSALWNAAYDSGMAAGAFAVGLLAPLTGYPPALLLTAVLMAATLPLIPAPEEAHEDRPSRGCPVACSALRGAGRGRRRHAEPRRARLRARRSWCRVLTGGR
ncbi:MFS transporter [Nonomuraea sp. NPDC004580]|uniref:MFS transporter n=1 Tax=Nonomuraea sp. NPDC004580 TaxID=3154552 RepID=UPI0033A00140